MSKQAEIVNLFPVIGAFGKAGTEISYTRQPGPFDTDAESVAVYDRRAMFRVLYNTPEHDGVYLQNAHVLATRLRLEQLDHVPPTRADQIRSFIAGGLVAMGSCGVSLAMGSLLVLMVH